MGDFIFSALLFFLKVLKKVVWYLVALLYLGNR